MSQETLGDVIGRSSSVISRIESGETPLKIAMAQRIATALDVSVAEVLGIEEQQAGPAAPQRSGLAEDCVPYEPPPGDPIASFRRGSNYLFQVTTNVVDRAGVGPGDVVVIDDSPEACKNPKPLAIVRVRMHPPEDFMRPVSLLRQFVPPSLLITNATSGNQPSIDMDHDDAHIVGVVVHAHRRFRY